MSECLEKVLLSDFFDIESPLQDDKINFELSDKLHPKSIPFLGRSSTNNGIVDYVSPKNSKVNTGGVITIALDGSTGATFYQHHDFCSGQNIWILRYKDSKIKKFNQAIALFLITSIRKAVKNYSYNLSLTKKRLNEIKVLLPINQSGELNTDYIENTMTKLRNIDQITELLDTRL